MTEATDWDKREDWTKGPYLSMNFDRFRESIQKGWKMPQLDMTHICAQFTLLGFSRDISRLWDWDLNNRPVQMSAHAALQAHRAMRDAGLTGEKYSLEALVYDGWEIPAYWFRAGSDETPHGWLGAMPVAAVLDDKLSKHDIAYLITSGYPTQLPAYISVLWVPVPLDDPDMERLNTILEIKQRESS